MFTIGLRVCWREAGEAGGGGQRWERPSKVRRCAKIEVDRWNDNGKLRMQDWGTVLRVVTKEAH